MPQYSVKVMCDKCSQVRPMNISIYLQDGPNIETSVGRVQTVTTVASLWMLPVVLVSAHEGELPK